MEQFIGQLMLFGGNFAPVGWLQCNGQLIAISENELLYTLLGTTYGGDGVTTFALPDLRGRVPIHTGTGPGLPTVYQGQMLGNESVTMTNATMPSHLHPANVTVTPGCNSTDDEESPTPVGNYLTQRGANTYATSQNGQTGPGTFGVVTSAIQPTGNNMPIPLSQPTLTMNYCIATEGIFPPHP